MPAPLINTQLPPALQVTQILFSKWLMKTVETVAKCEIADRLGDDTMTLEELANASNTNLDALTRVIKAMACYDFFQFDDEGKVSLGPLGQVLRTDHPESVRAFSMMLGMPASWMAWNHLEHSLRTGEPAFTHAHDQQVWEYFGEHPESAGIFDQAMINYSKALFPQIAETYDFSGITMLCDVGGGAGTMLSMVLQKYPEMRGRLFDQPPVIERAKKEGPLDGMHDRVEFVGGSFFENIPVGADAIMMKHIIHDWGNEDAARILKNCMAALPSGGRLLLLEEQLEGESEASTRLLDLEMLVMNPGGRERSRAEYQALLEGAGAKLKAVHPTPSGFAVFEGVKE